MSSSFKFHSPQDLEIFIAELRLAAEDATTDDFPTTCQQGQAKFDRLCNPVNILAMLSGLGK